MARYRTLLALFALVLTLGSFGCEAPSSTETVTDGTVTRSEDELETIVIGTVSGTELTVDFLEGTFDDGTPARPFRILSHDGELNAWFLEHHPSFRSGISTDRDFNDAFYGLVQSRLVPMARALRNVSWGKIKDIYRDKGGNG